MNVTDRDWPYNLFQALGLLPDDPLEYVCSESELLLTMNIGWLTEREKKVLMLRFYHQKTLEEVGVEIGLQRERVRQIEAKALRKLRHPHHTYILMHGVKTYIEKCVDEKVTALLRPRAEELEAEYCRKIAELTAEKAQEKAGENIADKKIVDLGLSIRPYNCLVRAGLETVGDILEKIPTCVEAYKIRNLGRRSIDEISYKLKEYGVQWPKKFSNEE